MIMGWIKVVAVVIAVAVGVLLAIAAIVAPALKDHPACRPATRRRRS
jgi:hypothetical protein